MKEFFGNEEMLKVRDVLATILKDSQFWLVPNSERAEQVLQKWLQPEVLKLILSQLMTSGIAHVGLNEIGGLMVLETSDAAVSTLVCDTIKQPSSVEKDMMHSYCTVPVDLLQEGIVTGYKGTEIRAKLFMFHGKAQGLIRVFQREIVKELSCSGLEVDMEVLDKNFIDLLDTFNQNGIYFEPWAKEEQALLRAAWQAGMMKETDYQQKMDTLSRI